jgi:hypothetical protein
VAERDEAALAAWKEDVIEGRHRSRRLAGLRGRARAGLRPLRGRPWGRRRRILW